MRVKSSATTDRKTRLLLSAVLALGVALRAYRLGYQSIWGDERWDTWFARHDLVDLLRVVRDDAFHPPLYYLGLHFWIDLAGTSAAALRTPPLVAGVVTILFTFLLARRLFTPSTALIAAAFGAVSQLAIMYSQDATSYALYMCLSVIQTCALVVALQQKRRRDWILLAAVTTMFLYTHYFACLVIGGQFLFLLLRRRAYPGGLARFTLVGLVATLLPWVVAVAGELTTTERTIGPGVGVSLRSLDRMLTRFNNGRVLGIHERSSPIAILLGFLAFTVPAGVAMFGGWRRRERLASTHSDGIILCTILAFGPLAVLFALSLANPRFQFVYHRYLLICLAPYYILAARGYASIGLPTLRTGAVCMTIALSLVSCRALYMHYKPDWRGALTYLHASMPNSAVCRSSVYLLDDLVELNSPGFTPVVSPIDLETGSYQAHDEIWLISVTWTEWHRDVARQVAERMRRDYEIVSSSSFRDMDVVVYRRISSARTVRRRDMNPV